MEHPVPRIELRVRRSARGTRPEHVVDRGQVVETEPLQRLDVVPDHGRIGSDLGLRKDRPNSHRLPPLSRPRIDSPRPMVSIEGRGRFEPAASAPAAAPRILHAGHATHPPRAAARRRARGQIRMVWPGRAVVHSRPGSRSAATAR